jgi:hypothetical protein
VYRSFLNLVTEAGNGIHGTVTDSLTGEPLQALVYIENHDLDHSYVETTLPYGDYHRPIKAGQYAVTYSAEGYLPKTIATTVADGEKTLQNVQLSKSVGIPEYDKRVNIYPNPVQDFLTVELSDGTKIDNISLYDIQGRLVETFPGTSLQIAKLDVRHLPAGTYILHVRLTNAHELIRKIHVL